MDFAPLLDYLSQAKPTEKVTWTGWKIQPIVGGHNNLLYRVSRSQEGDDVAVKFTMRDARHRARREYQTLSLLNELDLEIGPKPLLLDEHRYSQPVVVQSWLPGEVSWVAPESDAKWQRLIEHYGQLHAITPEEAKVTLPETVLMAHSLTGAAAVVNQQVERIPIEARAQALDELVSQLPQLTRRDWSERFVSLNRGDPSIQNFLQRSGPWASVDWEYSGWGDPAFELAELLCHPSYETLTDERRRWFIHEYANLRSDEAMAERIWAYYPLILIWWCARLAQYVFEVPRGLDPRLAERPTGFEDELAQKYRRYVERTNRVLVEQKG